MISPPSLAIFDEILDFLAKSPSPEAIINYQVAEALDQELQGLLEKNQHDTLTDEETLLLDEFLRMNRFLLCLKLRAQLLLDHAA